MRKVRTSCHRQMPRAAEPQLRYPVVTHNALAAGLGTFALARVMGTSLDMLGRTYGHLVRGADGAFRARRA